MTTNQAGTYDPAGPGATDDSSSNDVKDRAQQAAGTAADEARNVAETAKSEAKNVADEARSQAGDLLGQATAQVDDQAKVQRDRLVGVLGSFGDDLDRMGAEGNGLAADLAQEVAQRAHGLSAHLDGREPRQLLDDVRSFARRQPGTFLLGALVAGVVVGRLTRGARDADSSPGDVSAARPPFGGSSTPPSPVAAPVSGPTAGGPVTPEPIAIPDALPHTQADLR